MAVDLAPELWRLEAALYALGTEPDAIASHLTQEGCFGDSDTQSCPLARYLRRVLGGRQVSVSGGKVYVFWIARGVVNLPRPVRYFIHYHDQGRYPFLRLPPLAEDWSHV